MREYEAECGKIFNDEEINWMIVLGVDCLIKQYKEIKQKCAASNTSTPLSAINMELNKTVGEVVAIGNINNNRTPKGEPQEV